MEEEKDRAKPVLGLFGSYAESLLRMEIAQLQHENATLKATAAKAIALALAIKGAERVRALNLAYALVIYEPPKPAPPPRNNGGRPPGRLSFSKAKINHADWWNLFQIAWNRMDVPPHPRKTQKMAIGHLVKIIEQHEIQEMGGRPWNIRKRALKEKRIADCDGQVISDSLMGFFCVDSLSKASGDELPSFECSLATC